MSELRDRLDDLLAEAPSYVVPDAGVAWRTGARRRVRRRVGTGAVVAVLVLLVGLGAGLLPRPGAVDPARSDGAGVDGYPTRIDRSYWIRDLPDAPGPMAGLLRSSGGWLVVSSGGRLWRLPDQSIDVDAVPAISADGRRIGYLEGGPDDTARYVVRDLVTGTRTEIAEIGSAATTSPHPYLLWGQSPSFWSPDGRRLLVAGDRRNADRARVSGLLLDQNGAIAEVPLDVAGTPYRLGWVDKDSLGWLQWRDPASGGTRRVHLLVTDLGGRVERRVSLGPVPPVDDFSQWSGTLSPDGTRLALSDVGAVGTYVRVFDTVAGDELEAVGVNSSLEGCLPGWSGDQVVVAATTAQDGIVGLASGRVLVRADPRLGVTCSLWASEALAGEAHEGLGGRVFGDSGSWLSWHVHEITFGTLLLAGAGLLTWFLRRQARRRAEDVMRSGGQGDQLA